MISNANWRDAIVRRAASVQNVVDNINVSGLQIALVVDEDGRLEGTITDGDIRRGLLRGLGLTTLAQDILHPKPMVVNPDISSEIAARLMRVNKIHQLPIVDEDGRLVGLYTWDEIFAPIVRPNIMVIMAGGFGKRLRPYTEDCPKPMLPVAGKPMLQHIIERAQGEGFTRFVLSLHYLEHVIKNHFGDGSAFGVNIAYLHEDTPLGTAGAIALLDPVPDAPFIVTNGDVLSDIRYGELLAFHSQNAADATMAVRQYEWQHPFGVVRMKGRDIVGFEEKPMYRSYVNTGIYALNPSALAFLNKGERCDMPTLFECLREADRRIIAYPIHEPWLDVGRSEDLDYANELF